MQLDRSIVAMVAASLVLATSLPVRAQGADTTEGAIAALDANRYADARRIAQAVIEQGTRTGAELAPLYRVLGLAAAHANDEEAARIAFTHWLALEPEGRLDRSLPDEVRSPFMEARGFWSTTTGRLGATAELSEGLDGIVVRVSDPSSIAARARARVRLAGGAWADTVRPPADEMAISLPGFASARALDYSITLLDEHGNRVWQQGSDAAPLHIEAPAAELSGGETQPSVATTAPDATGFHVAAITSAIVLAGALIGGALTHVERERLAALYNGDGTACTGTGSLRGDVCAPERSALQASETAAIVLYSVAGAAAITAVILAAVAPSAQREQDVALHCGPGPGLVGVGCGGAF